MKKQSIVWTTLPVALTAAKLRLSIYIAPQLDSDAAKPTLKLFSDLLDWPNRMRKASFKIGFRDPAAPGPDVILDATVVNGPDNDTHWNAIFSEATPIKPFTFANYPDRLLRSYSIRNILTHVKDVYTQVALQSPDEKPKPTDLLGNFKDLCFYDIPVRTKPKTSTNFSSNTKSSAVPPAKEDRAYKRTPMSAKRRMEYYSSLDQMLSSFVPLDALKKRKAPDKETQKFRDRIKQDYLFLVQDPSTKLCSTATEALNSLYRQLGEFQCVPPSAPNKTKDFLQMSLYYKPRNAVNDKYLPTSWLRSQQTTGKPFYYAGAADRKAGTKPLMSNSRTMASGMTAVSSDIMHEGETHPYAVAAKVKPEFDFHQILNSLNRFPWLMRKLGLVIDVEVDASTVPKAVLGKECHCYVIPNWTSDSEPGVPKTNFFPRTAYLLEDKLFSAAPKSSAAQESLHGLMRLGLTDYFDVVSLEPGGSALKVLHTVNNLSRNIARFSPLYVPEGWDLNELHPESPDNDSSEALAALRNNGIGIARHGMAYSLVNTLKSAKTSMTNLVSKQNFIAANNIAAANAIDKTQILYAEDLTRGWRADYKDLTSGSDWRSLMARDGKYQFLKNSSLDTNVSDEGFVSPSASQSSDGSSEDLYTGEMLFEWSGWSLVAPRPAKTLTKDEMKADGSPDLEDPGSGTATSDGTQIKVHFLPTAKTLPRLRYGHVYKVRARTVDLAGNSWSINEAPEEALVPKTQSPKVKYLRHDVVKTPVVLLRDALTQKSSSGETIPLSHAETVEQLVIRSNRKISTGDYAAAHPPFKADTVRYLCPPKVDYTFAETHGVFDARYFDTNKWSDLYALITHKDYQFSNASSGGYTCFTADPCTNDTIVTGSFQLPYLPDPLAKGVVLRGIPGTRAEMNGATIVKSASIVYIRSNGDVNVSPDSANNFPKGVVVIEYPYADDPAQWLSAYPHDGYLRIQVVELNEGEDPLPKWDTASRTLTVRVAKSDMFRVAYASLLRKKDTDAFFALRSWLEDAPASAQRTKALTFMELSSHWMLTPYRNLLLTHAVQQPLTDPEWYKQSLTRAFGQSYAILKDEKFGVHGKSTVKVDVNAFWELQVDNTTLDTPQDIRLAEYDASNPDHKNRRAQTASLPAGEVQVNKRNATHVNLALNHDFKDTLHRLVEYEPVGTTRFREYFPQTGYDFSVKGKRWKKHVLSTKRPEAIKLQYIVPVFAWATDKKENSIVRTRMAGLRVYMDRPWFSSGSDEKLGVILVKNGTAPNTIMDSPVEKMVTMWGYDPIWLSKPTPSELFPLSAFFLTKTRDLADSEMKQGVISGVSFDELSADAANQKKYEVDVALHDVHFDTDRKLWYSDIMLAHGESYFPFVRLALCRVQPYSLRQSERDVFISRVTQADYMQIMPLRKTNINFDASDPLSVRVSVEGVSYRASHVGVLESEVEVTLEKKTPTMGADFGWTEVSTTPIDRVNAGVLGGFWGGTVKLPAERSSTNYRIVVKEYEQLHADLYLDRSLKRGGPQSRTSTQVARRIVFADAIEI